MQGDYLRRGTAEFIGAFALTFFGASAIMVGSAGLLGVALAHGLAIALIVTSFAHISGGHFNPAITLGFLVTRRIDPKLAVVYWLEQFAGACTAGLLLWWIFPKEAIAPARLGAPLLHPSIGSGAGFAIEAILTFFLVLAVFAIAVDDRGAFKAVAGFGIGLVITMDVLAGGPLTGAAMNPSRAFGPELVYRRLGELHLDLLRGPGRRRGRRCAPLRVPVPAPEGADPARRKPFLVRSRRGVVPDGRRPDALVPPRGVGPGARLPPRRAGVLVALLRRPGRARRGASRSSCSTRAEARAPTARRRRARTQTADYVADLDELRGAPRARADAAARPLARRRGRRRRTRPPIRTGSSGSSSPARSPASPRSRRRRWRPAWTRRPASPGTPTRGGARGRAGGPLRDRRGARRRSRCASSRSTSPASATRSGRTSSTLRGEVPVADALLLFNNEIFTTFDLRPELPKIIAPTLVITGEDDFITGPACAADFAAIPGPGRP